MDIEQEIGKALADPEIMNKVGSLLSQLTEGQDEKTTEKGDVQPITENNNGTEKILKALSGNINDDRTRLLLAIKPFLSEKRAPYMDSALTVMKLVSMGKIGKDLKLF